MARRGRQNDEIKKLVEILQGTNTMSITVNDPSWTLLQGVTDAPTFSTHAALLAYGASYVPIFTAPRSAMYRIQIKGSLSTSFPPAAVFGDYTTAQAVLMNTPKTTPTPRISFPPLAAPIYKLTAAGSAATGFCPFFAELVLLLEAGEEVGVGFKYFYSGAAPGTSAFIVGPTTTVDFITDSRRVGSF